VVYAEPVDSGVEIVLLTLAEHWTDWAQNTSQYNDLNFSAADMNAVNDFCQSSFILRCFHCTFHHAALIQWWSASTSAVVYETCLPCAFYWHTGIQPTDYGRIVIRPAISPRGLIWWLVYDTIWYGRLTCVQELTVWPS